MARTPGVATQSFLRKLWALFLDVDDVPALRELQLDSWVHCPGYDL